MNCRPKPSLQNVCKGYTLVEMMVALGIGILLSMGALTLVSSTTRNFGSQDQFARLQENALFALNDLGDAVRHAGYYGLLFEGDLIRPADVARVVETTALQDCVAANWAFATNTPIEFFANNALGCIPAANYGGGPLLVTRSAGRIPVAPGALRANGIYVQSDPVGGIIFFGDMWGTGAGQLETSATPSRLVLNGAVLAFAPILEYEASIFYLRRCSRATVSGECATNADGGTPIPTLVRRRLDASSGVPAYVDEPLAEGVERMTLMFGLDQDGNGVAERFTLAPLPAEISDILEVRITLLVRTPQPVPGHNDAGKAYNLAPGIMFQCNVVAGECRFQRHIYAKTFQLRSRAIQRAG